MKGATGSVTAAFALVLVLWLAKSQWLQSFTKWVQS